MTPRSINGWPVIKPGTPDTQMLATRTIPGTAIRVTLNRDAAPILLAVAAAVDTRVLPLGANNLRGRQDEGGWNYRPARLASASWSDHASGTALDLNWSLWPAFRRRMTPVQRAAAQAIAGEYQEVVIWGGNYSRKNADEMHWAIKPGTSAAELAAFAARALIRPDGSRKK